MKVIEVLGHVLNVFPLIEGQIGVGSTDGVNSDGVFESDDINMAVACVSDGSIIFTFATGGTETVTFSAGEKYGAFNCVSLDIQSGTFNVA